MFVIKGKEFSSALMDIGLCFISCSPRGEKLVLEEMMFAVHITSVISHYGMHNQASWMPFLDVDAFSIGCLVTPYSKIRQTP